MLCVCSQHSCSLSSTNCACLPGPTVAKCRMLAACTCTVLPHGMLPQPRPLTVEPLVSISVCVRQHRAAAHALSCALLYTQFRHGIQSAIQQPDRLFVTAHRAMGWVLLRIAGIQDAAAHACFGLGAGHLLA
jgi:hypothetical protein